MPINVPKHDLSVFTIPKNGGTTLRWYCYFLRTGRVFGVKQKAKGKRYNIYHQGWMRGKPLGKKLIVVRDPVDRFVSGYRNCRDKRGLRVDFDTFVQRFRSIYRRNSHVHHHFRPQSKCVARPLDEFEYVIRFSQYHNIRNLLEEITGIQIPEIHRQKSWHPKPVPSEAQTEFIREFYQRDYEQGFCELPE